MQLASFSPVTGALTNFEAQALQLDDPALVVDADAARVHDRMALATAAGYAAGFGGGATVGGIQGAGTVIGNAMFEGAGEDLFGGSPTPEPLAVKPKEVDHQQHNPAEPVPPYLLDLAEREAAAKKTSLVVGQWGSKQQDKKRLDKQKIEDAAAASRRAAEETIAKYR